VSHRKRAQQNLPPREIQQSVGEKFKERIQQGSLPG
jgi:hypothetical protein